MRSEGRLRLAIALGGSDFGRSGIGTYVRAVLPRILRAVQAEGGEAIVLGSRRDTDAYADVMAGALRRSTPDACDKPAVGALWYLTMAGVAARRAGADVLLLPAANRRVTALSPIPTVAVVHDLAQLHVPEKYDPLRMAYSRYGIIGALRTVSALVAVSAATKSDLVRAIGHRGDSARVIPNGVEHERFLPAKKDDPRVALARTELGLDRPYVLYPARLEHPGKNHLRLLGAFAASRLRGSYALVLAGADWGAGERIREEIDRLGLAKDVRVVGFVKDEILPGLVAGADAVAMVGLREGFGLPALEALAAGRPVLVSTTGALPEVVGDLGAMCDPMDERSIREALERAVYDEGVRDRAAKEGPAWAAARSWNRTADGLLEVCREVARA